MFNWLYKRIADGVVKSWQDSANISQSVASDDGYALTNSRYDSVSWQERYAKSDDVYACVNIIAETASAIPLRMLQGTRVVSDHQVLDLLKRPNPLQHGIELLHTAHMLLALEGEVFFFLEFNNPVRKDMLNTVWVVSGTRVEFEEGRTIKGYTLTSNTGEKMEVPAEQIVHVKLPNPFTVFRGLSPLVSLVPSLDMENEAKISNSNIFKNGILSGSILSVNAKTPAQLEATKSAVAQHQGGANAHKPLLVMGESFNVNSLSLSPKDMQFSELDKATTRDVAKVYRVPLQMLASDTADVLNLRTYRRMLYEDCVLPKVQLMLAALNESIIPDGLELEIDLDQVEALRPDWVEVENPNPSAPPPSETTQAGLQSTTLKALASDRPNNPHLTDAYKSVDRLDAYTQAVLAGMPKTLAYQHAFGEAPPDGSFSSVE